MRAPILVGAALVASILAIGLSNCEPGHFLNPGLYARFGNFGGLGRKPGEPEPFDPKAIKFGIRWYPTYVSFGPDNDTLLVSLCHVSRDDFCRIGRYSLSQDKWDILPFEEHRTYRDPMFSPDGKWIVFSTAPCNAEALCDARDHQLARMSLDGSKMEIIADTVALYPSFSRDGRKLIYWRWEMIVKPGQPKHPGGRNLYQLDWATGKETALTDLLIMPGDERGRPLFTPGGEKFLFQIDAFALGLNKAPNTLRESTVFLIGDMKNVPITNTNIGTLEAIKKDTGFAEPCDIDAQGRILYAADLGDKKRQGSPVAIALRPAESKPTHLPPSQEEQKFSASKLTEEQLRKGDGVWLAHQESIEGRGYLYREGYGPALFLRKPEAGSTDEVGFDIPQFNPNASVSADGTLLAFVQPQNSRAPTVYSSIGLISHGQSFKDVRYILNWPKLDLTPTVPVNH